MLMWLFGCFIALLVLLVAIYYLAPGIALDATMRLARRMGRLHSKRVELDSHEVPYLEGGSGEPLLLLHGFGANKDHWTMIAPHLTPHFHVYAPDLPGFGDSSRHADARYDVDSQIERIASFADHMGLDSFHLGGNSMGGYLATLFATRYPERVRSLWLLAPAGVMGAEPSEVLEILESGTNPLVAESPEAFDRLSELVFVTAPPMPAQFKRPLLARSRREAAFNHRLFEELFGAEPLALEPVIGGLDTRTLVVWGDNDRVLHDSGLEILCGLLQNAEGIRMSRMGHVPMIERPAETAMDFLRFHGRVK